MRVENQHLEMTRFQVFLFLFSTKTHDELQNTITINKMKKLFNDEKRHVSTLVIAIK